jgi:hypothetical protein
VLPTYQLVPAVTLFCPRQQLRVIRVSTALWWAAPLYLIPEVPDSNLGQEPGDINCAETLPPLRHDHFLPNPFQCIYIHLCSRLTDTNLKDHINKKFLEERIDYFPRYDTGHIENDALNNSSVVACVFVTAVTFLPNRCLATIRAFLPCRYLATIGEGDTQKHTHTQTATSSYKPTLFFQNMRSILIKKTPWFWSASELCRPSDRRFLAK